jgi:hypothetical protein
MSRLLTPREVLVAFLHPGEEGHPVSATGVRPIPTSVTGSSVQRFAAIAIGLHLLLLVSDFWRYALLADFIDTGLVVVAAALVVLLHLRHVLYGLRGQRAPGGLWTLAALVGVNAIATAQIGSAWMLQFAPLVVSMLLVLRMRVAAIPVLLLTISPLVLADPTFGIEPAIVSDASLPATYLSLTIAWRSITLYVPVRLVAALRQLEAARLELEMRAVVQARTRIDGELRVSVGTALERIITRGEDASRIPAADHRDAITELRTLVADSRRALTEARRIVAGYRASSLRAQLDAAVALLEARGAHVRVMAASNIDLDAPDERSRLTLRAALEDALRSDPLAGYLLSVDRDAEEGGALRIRVSADEGAATA